MKLRFLVFGLILGAVLAACGVKGPPLPPIPDTPQKSDPQRVTPTPTPTQNQTPNQKNGR